MEKINAKQHTAIEKKYEGESYNAIAKIIKTPLSTIKGWFEKDGLLHQEYEDYALEMNKIKRRVAEQNLVRHVVTACNMLVALLGSDKDEVKFRACKEILDRVLGVSNTEMVFEPTDEQMQEWYKRTMPSHEELIKKVEEYNEQYNAQMNELFAKLEGQFNKYHVNHKDVQETVGEIRQAAYRFGR